MFDNEIRPTLPIQNEIKQYNNLQTLTSKVSFEKFNNMYEKIKDIYLFVGNIILNYSG